MHAAGKARPMNDLASLRGKSVFVTGHTGFKGSWLCLWLARLGARVTGYALEAPTRPSNFVVSGVRDVLHDHHHGDIRDEERLTAAMARARPDLVLHLAAQSVVREGYANPRETFDVNVMGTIGVLEAVRRLERPCAVVCVTSDKCYENVEQVWGYREMRRDGRARPLWRLQGRRRAGDPLLPSIPSSGPRTMRGTASGSPAAAPAT